MKKIYLLLIFCLCYIYQIWSQIPKFCSTTNVSITFKNNGLKIPYKLKVCNDSIFVDTSGSDLTGDGSKLKPFKTIQIGVDNASNGQCVIINNGIFKGNGNTNINPNGKSIVIQSKNGAGYTHINGENKQRGFLLNSGESQTTIIRGFTLINCVPPSNTPSRSNTDGHGGGVFCDENSGVTIENCYFFNCNRVIDLGNREQATSNSTYIKNCVFEANKIVCILGDKVTFYFDSCIFQNNSVDEIHGKGHVNDPPGSANFNIFRNNYSADAVISATGHGFVIANCLYYDNKCKLGVVYHGTTWSGSPMVDHCTFYNNCPSSYSSSWWDHIGTTKNSIFAGFNTNILDHISGNQSSITFAYNNGTGITGSGNISGNPQFKDSSIYDFSLKSGSICIGADENGNDIGANFSAFPKWMLNFPYLNNVNVWAGTGNINNTNNWSIGDVPGSSDSVHVVSGTMTVNQSSTLDVLRIHNGATVKLSAPLTVRNLYLKNGTLDLNGYKLTVTGKIVHSTDSTNYYIQAGTSASPKPNSELVFAPTANTSSTLYFNPNANTLKVLELGTSSKTAQVTMGNALKIKGGKTASNVGSLKVNNGSKLIIPNGASFTLQSDTFNAYLNLAAPAQRAIHCQGTGTFNIERQHYGARGWRLYSHPFSADINLTQIADDIELIGSGGTSEGFYSDAYTNNAAFWYDYSKADTTATTDLAWTGFSSAKGTLISGNANKWKKNSPIIVFNPGAVRGSGAFSNPTSATYQEGKITLSYTLDSTAVHLNDGKTQSITTTDLTSAPKSRYFFLTNPFTAPVRLSRIQGLNLTNCANKFYYWKQNQASISSNFMPAAWASEALFNGNATRDSNISIPAFGTILIEMRNPSSTTTFTIPESAKQLTNFNYVVGGDLSSSGSGVKQTLFMELPQPYQGPGAIEVQLLMNDSVPVDRMLIYDRVGESISFTNNDAKKFKEPSFSNIYSLCRSGESLSLDAQDITARLTSGEDQVEIPLVIDRDFNKTQKNLRLRIGEKHSELECYFKDAKTGILTAVESGGSISVELSETDASINRYSLEFKRSNLSAENFDRNKISPNNQPQPEVIIYPNPANDVLHVRELNSNQPISYEISSITGNKVKTGLFSGDVAINIKEFTPGLYIFKTENQTTKFIINAR